MLKNVILAIRSYCLRLRERGIYRMLPRFKSNKIQ